MASLISDLITVLEEQIPIYEQLLEIGVKKKNSIISNNTDELQVFVSEENTLVGRSIKFDKSRDELFKDIAFVLNKKEEDVNLSTIAELIKGQDEYDRVIEVREKILDLLTKLKEVNDVNQELIEYSLEHIEYSMNVLRTTINKEPDYTDSSGNEINANNKRFFDAKQ